MIKKIIIGLCAVFIVAVAGMALKPDTADQIAASSKSASPSARSDNEPNPAALPNSADTPPPEDNASVLPETGSVTPMETHVDLWQADQQSPDTLLDGNPARRLQTSPGLIEQFHVGQTLRLRIPQSDTTIETQLDSTHNQTANVHVFLGRVVDGHPEDNVIVTRGKIETHVVISTLEGTYTAIIDNATGSTVMVDQADINARQVPFEDGIAVPGIEQTPPPG